MSDQSFTVRRVGRDARWMAAQLEEHEPRTTRMVSDLLTYRAWRWRRSWVVHDEAGALAAVLVVVRLCFDRWTAAAFLADVAAAPSVASLIDASAAWSVSGPAADVAPLVPHLRRRRDVMVSPWAIAPHPITAGIGPPDGRTRMATRLDFDQLVELYSGYEFAGSLTRWQLRQLLAHRLDRHLVAVCVVDGRIVGAALMHSRTRRFVFAADMTVDPAYREQGLAWELTKRMSDVCRGFGLGGSVSVAATNPMRPQMDGLDWDTAHHYEVTLSAPRRFKGETRLRRAYMRCGRLDVREPVFVRDPADPDRPPPPW